jgi:hypothetical protein
MAFENAATARAGNGRNARIRGTSVSTTAANTATHSIRLPRLEASNPRPQRVMRRGGETNSAQRFETEYLKRHVQIPTRRPRGGREMEILLAMLRRAEIPAANGTVVRLESKPLDAITRADIEAVRSWRRNEQAADHSRPGTKGGEVGTNRLLSRLRHVFSWSIAEGFVTDTPLSVVPSP